MNRNKKITRFHKQIAAGLSAAIVFTGVAAAIPNPTSASAATLTSIGTLTCTTQEHTHSSSCYTVTKTLICGQAEGEEHTHTDACYQTTETLTCTIPEHQHSEACYTVIPAEDTEPAEKDSSTEDQKTDTSEAIESEDAEATEAIEATEEIEDTEDTEEEETGDPTADLESAATWARSVSGVQLTGIYAEDLINIALSQIGYTESTRNFILNEKKEKKGYTRYGAWYGAPYMDWCAMFVAFCLNYAEVSTADMPRFGNCQVWINSLSGMGLYETRANYEPIPGDLVFFEWDGDGVSDHIGIVYQVSKDGDGHVTAITTIEGNSSNMVRTKSYAAGDTDIMGYGKLPQGKNYSQSVEVDQLEITVEYTGHANLTGTELYAEVVDEEDSLFESAEEEYEEAQQAKAENEGTVYRVTEATETTDAEAEASNDNSAQDTESEYYETISGTDELSYLLKIGFRDSTGTDTVPEEEVTYTVTIKDDADNEGKEEDGDNNASEIPADESADTAENAAPAEAMATESIEPEESDTEEIFEDVDSDFFILTNPDLADQDQPSTKDAEENGYDTLDFTEENEEQQAEFTSDTAILIATDAEGSQQVSPAETSASSKATTASSAASTSSTIEDAAVEAEGTAEVSESEEDKLLYFRWRNQKKPK